MNFVKIINHIKLSLLRSEGALELYLWWKGVSLIKKNVYNFGDKLLALRKRRGLSQKDAAKRLGLSSSTITKYENNSLTPSVEVLLELAVLYNSSTDYILGLSDRTPIYLDDFTEEQQQFIIRTAHQVNLLFGDKKAGD